MLSLIVILFNLLYPVFFVRFHYKSYVCERVWRFKTHWRSKVFSWVAHEKPSREVKHVLSAWLEYEESWQMMTAGFMSVSWVKPSYKIPAKHSILPICYMIHQVSTHTIYIHFTHILKGVLFREKILVITLESGRLSYPQSYTQSIVVFLNSYLSISKSLRGW